MSTTNSLGDLTLALKPAARVMQIVVAAMFIGVATFLCIAIVVRSDTGPPTNEPSQLLTFVGVGAAVLAFAANLIVPSAVIKQSRSKLAAGTFASAPSGPFQKLIEKLGDAGALCNVYQTKMIIGAALWEGAAFFNIIAFLLEGRPIALVPVGAALLAIALKFPTASRLAEWVNSQLRLIAEEKLLAR
jgi:hypothetical protein